MTVSALFLMGCNSLLEAVTTTPFILREALRNAGYQADTYAGWLFVGDTIPAHHCVVILNEDTVLDPTVIDYRKMALDKLDKREAVVDFLKSMQDKPKSSYTTFGQVLPWNDVLRIQMRSSCSTSDQSEAGKSIPEPPGVWPIYEGKEPDAHTGNDCERWDF